MNAASTLALARGGRVHPLHRADHIIRAAEQDRLAHEGSYAYMAGAYQAEIRALCAELATLAGADHRPGGLIETLPLGDTEAPVEFDYQPGEEAQIYGPPERCHEGAPEEVTILTVLINGVWIDPEGVIAPALIKRWEEQAGEKVRADIKDQADEAAIEAWQARREAAEYACF